MIEMFMLSLFSLVGILITRTVKKGPILVQQKQFFCLNSFHMQLSYKPWLEVSLSFEKKC